MKNNKPWHLNSYIIYNPYVAKNEMLQNAMQFMSLIHAIFFRNNDKKSFFICSLEFTVIMNYWCFKVGFT